LDHCALQLEQYNEYVHLYHERSVSRLNARVLKSNDGWFGHPQHILAITFEAYWVHVNLRKGYKYQTQP